MANIIQVFIKGDCYTPSRFWDTLLRTNTNQSVRWYQEHGYVLHGKYTKEYIEMSEEEKKKVNFTVNLGIKK